MSQTEVGSPHHSPLLREPFQGQLGDIISLYCMRHFTCLSVLSQVRMPSPPEFINSGITVPVHRCHAAESEVNSKHLDSYRFGIFVV